MMEDDFRTLCIQYGQFSYNSNTGYFVTCPIDMNCNNCSFYESNDGKCIPSLFTAKQEHEIISSLQSDYPEYFI